MFPTEYSNFLMSHREKQDNKVNKFAELKGSDHVIRHLTDMPESLYMALQLNLNAEEWDWLFLSSKRDGMAWFMKTFPQFKITADF